MSSSTVRQRSPARSERPGSPVRALLAAALLLGACGPDAVVPGAGGTPFAAAAPAVGSVATRPALAADEIQILHTNDLHGHLEAETVRGGNGSFQQGGMAGLAGLAAAYRARGPERTLLIDAGDAWEGTFASAVSKGEAMAGVMALMRYDAMAIGNHEFDYGQENLAKRAGASPFPYLAANLADAQGAVPSYARPYIVKDLGIVKVAVLGLTYPHVNTKASNVVGLRFTSAIEAARRWVPELRKQADIVVALTHLGIDQRYAWDESDVMLATAVPGIDVIVGGHSHTALRTARLVGTTTIVQAGTAALNLGRLDLRIAARKIVAVTRADELIAVAGTAAGSDPQVARIVEAQRALTLTYTARVVGSATSPLAASRDPDTGLGNLVADALLEYGRSQRWETDVSFYNGAGLRASLLAGPLTYGALFDALPFGNTVVNVDLTGAALRDVLEAASGGAGRLHPGGVRWTYRFENPPGRRVLSAAVGGKPIDPARIYHVATIDYLHLGGDGHSEFAVGTNVLFGDLDVDVVAAYVTAHSPVDPRPDGRVVQER
ncbi:MAG: bifunctional metallophosphatase/5'-nucleotidase [Chloroflexi bacterium]|nr:bifunctional metallophosphatase/5'-nucleotidase [Chloroflexota bacterium]